ncbi:BTB/POZ and MATH domain-containing protein 2-like [Copidosoma floridanum]|uniref:BTB/POZ and MATH domain-containing protein 2-like n=1 Tax=Copidosoma floridanum TaxID=29053 RepID=UPI0006C9CDD3|nr:BTB/POZ and MATH domain-containing protein 2-like [Copidosoma floridanum]
MDFLSNITRIQGVCHATFMWTIQKNYKDLPVGKQIESGMFHVNGNALRLVFTPKYFDAEDNEFYLSLGILSINKKNIHIRYLFNMINDHNCSFFMSDVREAVIEPMSTVGLLKFMKLKRINSDFDSVVMDNLRIMCQFWTDWGGRLDENQEPLDKAVRHVSINFDFEGMLGSEIESDVSFMVCGKLLRAHKVILINKSAIFGWIFYEARKKKQRGPIIIDNVRYEVMLELLRYIYCGKVKDMSVDMAKKLACAASRYGIVDLINISLEKIKILDPTFYQQTLLS